MTKNTQPKFIKFKFIGRYLKIKRIEADLSQTHVADFIGKTGALVSNWEKGKAPVSDQLLKKIMKLYRISRQEMIGKLLIAEEMRLKKSL